MSIFIGSGANLMIMDNPGRLIIPAEDDERLKDFAEHIQ